MGNVSFSFNRIRISFSIERLESSPEKERTERPTPPPFIQHCDEPTGFAPEKPHRKQDEIRSRVYALRFKRRAEMGDLGFIDLDEQARR